jgi:DNA-binding MarR family transcriptional regulator
MSTAAPADRAGPAGPPADLAGPPADLGAPTADLGAPPADLGAPTADLGGPPELAGPPDPVEAPPELAGRLAYLLKHAQLGLAELTAEALAPFGVSGRELGVLTVLAGQEPGSQQQAAQRLGVDRTTMVGLVDALEGKGLVRRHAHAEDRRRNVVELTEAGRDILDRAGGASVDAERRFLAPLSPRDAGHLKTALLALIRPGR